MKKEISKLLKRMGFSAALLGYEYTKTAIILVLKEPHLLRRLTTHLYPAIAKQYHVSSASVERNIRNAIEIAWLRGDLDTINEIFQYSIDVNRGKPTNLEFISVITEYLQLEKDIMQGLDQ